MIKNNTSTPTVRQEAIRIVKKYVNPKHEELFGQGMAVALFWLNRGACDSQVKSMVKQALDVACL